MSELGIKPVLKMKILETEYNCLTKANDYFSRQEIEEMGGDSASIGNYLLVSQKKIPFVFLNNIRGPFDLSFFDHLDEFTNWFKSRSSSKLSVILIPSTELISFVNELFKHNFALSGYVCYWYKNLEDTSGLSYNKNNIILADNALADSFADVITKGFEFDPKGPFYQVFYDLSKLSFKFPMDVNVNFLYKKDDTFVGSGSVICDEDFAFLANGAVLPAYRGHQIQQELINYRLDYARSKGFKKAIVTTGLDSTSGRNMQRLGFQLAFTAELFSLTIEN